MITNGEKWHYLAVKSLPALLRGLTSNHNKEFYCSNCFHSYVTKNRLQKHERVCNDHDHCYVEMPNEDNKILQYSYGEKSSKAPFFISFDILLQKSLSVKKAKHTPSGYSWFTCCSFDALKIELGCYRGTDCMKGLCEDFKD